MFKQISWKLTPFSTILVLKLGHDKTYFKTFFTNIILKKKEKEINPTKMENKWQIEKQ